MIFEILLKIIFFYGGYLALKGEWYIGELGKYRAGRWVFAVTIWSIIIVDTYQNYIEGKYT